MVSGQWAMMPGLGFTFPSGFLSSHTACPDVPADKTCLFGGRRGEGDFHLQHLSQLQKTSGLRVILPLSMGAALQLGQLFSGCPWSGPLWPSCSQGTIASRIRAERTETLEVFCLGRGLRRTARALPIKPVPSLQGRMWPAVWEGGAVEVFSSLWERW